MAKNAPMTEANIPAERTMCGMLARISAARFDLHREAVDGHGGQRDLAGIDAGLEFVLYKCGPFSFDMRDKLGPRVTKNMQMKTSRRIPSGTLD